MHGAGRAATVCDEADQAKLSESLNDQLVAGAEERVLRPSELLAKSPTALEGAEVLVQVDGKMQRAMVTASCRDGVSVSRGVEIHAPPPRPAATAAGAGGQQGLLYQKTHRVEFGTKLEPGFFDGGRGQVISQGKVVSSRCPLRRNRIRFSRCPKRSLPSSTVSARWDKTGSPTSTRA